MHISQIFICDDCPDELPSVLANPINSVKTNITHTQHTLYLHQPLREWIAHEYGNEMLKAFDKIKPYAYKADLGRYLLLYKLGGWYVDITIRVVLELNVSDNVDFIAFGEDPYFARATYSCNNGLFYAKAGSPILADTIDDVCANIAREYYGKNQLYPTGPICFGRNIAKHAANLQMVSGLFTRLTPHMPKKNIAFVFLDGTIVAWYRDTTRGGDWSSLNITGTNDYMQMYSDLDVYDRNITVSPYLTHQGIQAA